MKRLLVLAVLLCAALLAFAGGQPEPKTGAAGAAPATKTPVQEANTAFAFPKEPVKLTYWDYYDERPLRIELMRTLSKEYSKIHPNVTIEVVNIPWVGYKEKYAAAYAAGTGPDLVTWDPPTVVPLGLAVPAPDWAAKIIDASYTDLAKKMMFFQGKYWGWPGQIDVGQMLYYNKDMYAEVGLSKAPETLPELIDYSKKLTKYDASGEITRGGYAIRYFGERGGLLDKFRPFAWCYLDATKGWIWNQDYSDVIFDQPAYLEALKLYRDMVYTWKISSIKFPKPVEAIWLRLAAQTNREAFLIGDLKKNAPDLKYGLAPMVNGAPPYGKYQVGYAPSPGQSVMITTKKYADLSWDVSLFLDNDANDLKLAQTQGTLPARKVNMASSYVTQEVPYGPIAQIIDKRPSPRVEVDPWGVTAEINDSCFGEAVEMVLIGKKTPEQALKDAAAKARSVIARVKK